MLHLLKKRSFGAMTLSQFLGAFNDNAFKTLILILVAAVEREGQPATGWVAESGLSGLGQALPTTLFALPFVIFGPITGALADRLSKSTIIKAANLLEIVVMGAATVAFWLASYEALLATVFLMGTQSAIFGPSKYGVIKELVGKSELSPANALIQSSTMIAILGGNVVGGVFAEHLQGHLWGAGLWYIAFATLGWLVSLRIDRLPAANPTRKIAWSPITEFRRHWGATEGNRHLVLAIWASALFYLLATTFVPIVIAYGTHTLGLKGTDVGALNAFTIVGIVLGALCAGRISKDRIEGGLVPLGLAGMSLSALVVQLAPGSLWNLRLSLLGLGFGSGLFTIPIRCLIQGLPRENQRGGVQGLAETMDFVGILLGGGLFYLLDKVFSLTPPQMFLVCALILAAFAVATLVITAEFALRLMLLTLTHTVYRLRIRGLEHLPREGGALLVSNHVSFVDAVLIASASPRRVRFLMYREYFSLPLLGWFARSMGAIPVSSEDSRAAKTEALKAAADAARRGELVCIFAEGSITRTGAMLPFARGLERIARDAEVEIVPVALDRMWGSVFSYEGGRFFRKRPQRLPYPVDVLFGAPLPSRTPASLVRIRVQELIAAQRATRDGRRGSLAWRFVVSAKAHGRRPAIVDDTGARLSYRKLLVSALVLRSVLRRLLVPGQQVGVLLPAGAGGALVNVTLALEGRTAVNLNTTLSNEALAAPLARAEVRQVITSRRFLRALERTSPVPDEDTLLLEDLLEHATGADRRRAIAASLLPARWLAGRVSPQRSASETAMVIFSSGSTGEPKGVELTHANVLSNVQSVLAVLPIGPGQAVLGVLPFFHSFGTTVTLWTVLLSGAKAVYCSNPLDAKTVGRLAGQEGVTVSIATPTFYQAWMRRVTPEAFAHLRLAVSGAEKLPAAVAQAFRERYGLTLLEGYGCTECGPVVSFNLPEAEGLDGSQRAAKPGTIGRPLPGVAVRVVDLDTGEPLTDGNEGLLEVKGASVMKGYLGEAERTAEVLSAEGWYSTGDVGLIDRDGFLHITDRLARFSKIGGEMVPHGRVEEELRRIADRLAEGSGEPPELAVTALPDERKGERLVVVHTALDFSVESLLAELAQSDLPALFRPRAANFVEVEGVPKLATGKTDLRGLRVVAQERLVGEAG